MSWIKIILAFLAIVALVVVGGFVWVRYFAAGFSAREQPSAPERFFALQARKLAVPREARTLKNPLGSSEPALAEGRAH